VVVQHRDYSALGETVWEHPLGTGRCSSAVESSFVSFRTDSQNEVPMWAVLRKPKSLGRTVARPREKLLNVAVPEKLRPHTSKQAEDRE
jgi:hypothetical protein